MFKFCYIKKKYNLIKAIEKYNLIRKKSKVFIEGHFDPIPHYFVLTIGIIIQNFLLLRNQMMNLKLKLKKKCAN